MSAGIFVPQSAMTAYLTPELSRLDPIRFPRLKKFDETSYAIIESGHIADLTNHSIHPEAGISARNRGTIGLRSFVRGDELENPVVWLFTESITSELVARATIGPYFGCKPSRWVTTNEEFDAVVIDDRLALSPLETEGFHEDLVKAWFVLTGLPLVTHVLAVPNSADSEETAEVASWIQSAGGLLTAEQRLLHEQYAAGSGATRQHVAEIMNNITWTMGVEERRAIPELFARSGLGSRYVPVKWLS